MEQHPNFVKQLAEIRQREIDRHHLEALGEHVRRAIMALAAEHNFDIEHDHWGTEKTMLRHRSGTGGWDYEIPLGESE